MNLGPDAGVYLHPDVSVHGVDLFLRLDALSLMQFISVHLFVSRGSTLPRLYGISPA